MPNRDDDWRRVSELAGVDENGNILPPPPGTKIDQRPKTWWRNHVKPKEE